MKLSEIDKNMKVESTIKEDDVVWCDLKKGGFDVYGLYDYKADGPYRRMPSDIADNVNEGVANLNYHTAGGRVRFSTDSPYIAMRVKYRTSRWNMPNMALIGSSGADLYCDMDNISEYYVSFIPTPSNNNGFESIVYPFEEAKMRSYTINLALYCDAESIEIGLKSGSELLGGKKYKYEKPVVFYGSSITQGAAASRPGNCYVSMLSRMCDTDIINLGFSGSAKAEDIICDYIAGLDMSAFVYDYDHNSPSPETLEETHERFFKKIRAAKPDLPVIMISRPDFDGKNVPDNIRRRNTVYKTYINAVSSGDKNVFFIDGERLFDGPMRDSCTIDNCHPTDLGFYRMATVIYPVLQRVL